MPRRGGQSRLFGAGDDCGYALKADVRHYFDTVDHEVLLGIIRRKITDRNVLWLISVILRNHKTDTVGKGMPLGNLTSQFFANVYLNDLDRFVKHTLKARYYLRYVDDFIILHKDRKQLERWKIEINDFLRSELKLGLHPEKSRIVSLKGGVTMLGFRVFPHHRLLKKSNARRIWKRLERFRRKYDAAEMTLEEAVRSLDGWLAYARFANTYKLRTMVIVKFNDLFGTRLSPKSVQ